MGQKHFPNSETLGAAFCEEVMVRNKLREDHGAVTIDFLNVALIRGGMVMAIAWIKDADGQVLYERTDEGEAFGLPYTGSTRGIAGCTQTVDIRVSDKNWEDVPFMVGAKIIQRIVEANPTKYGLAVETGTNASGRPSKKSGLILEHRTVVETRTKEQFDEQVNALLLDGWWFRGELIIYEGRYVQSMTRVVK